MPSPPLGAAGNTPWSVWKGHHSCPRRGHQKAAPGRGFGTRPTGGSCNSILSPPLGLCFSKEQSVLNATSYSVLTIVALLATTCPLTLPTEATGVTAKCWDASGERPPPSQSLPRAPLAFTAPGCLSPLLCRLLSSASPPHLSTSLPPLQGPLRATHCRDIDRRLPSDAADLSLAPSSLLTISI